MWLLTAVEVTFALVLVAGVWFIFWPAALILAGLLGIVACELASARAARRVGDEVVRKLRVARAA